MEFKTLGQEVVTGVGGEEKESWDRAPGPSTLEAQAKEEELTREEAEAEPAWWAEEIQIRRTRCGETKRTR